jgi:hypothetical protein
MVPRCGVRQVTRRQENEKYSAQYCLWTPAELYPEHGYSFDTLPGEIRDWMVRRGYLVNAWKSSYNQFLKEFIRWEECNRPRF